MFWTTSPWLFLFLCLRQQSHIIYAIKMVEIVETSADEASPLLSNSNPNPTNRTRSVRTKVPEVEVHLYRRGKGPVDVFKSCLGGWDQDQLDVREILDKYGFKSVYAFKPESGRGVPIRFNPRNGRSILTYHDGSKIYVDGEPKVISFFYHFTVLLPGLIFNHGYIVS